MAGWAEASSALDATGTSSSWVSTEDSKVATGSVSDATTFSSSTTSSTTGSSAAAS